MLLDRSRIAAATPSTRQVAEETIAAFRKAAEAVAQIPLRQGNVLHLTPAAADEVIIAADLHGNRLNFNRLVETAALDVYPRRHLVLQEVCHGGPSYPAGGGCMSHLLLEDVARLIGQFPDRVHFLLGNHELAELTDHPVVKGGRMLNLLFRIGVERLYGRYAQRVRDAYNELLRQLPLAARIGDLFIAHSIPDNVDTRPFEAGVLERPLTRADLLEGGAVFRMVWGRDYRPANSAAFADLVGARVLLTGHEPCPRGFQTPNDRHVIIDTCGEIACIVRLPLARRLSFSYDEVVSRIERLV